MREVEEVRVGRRGAKWAGYEREDELWPGQHVCV